MARNNNKCDDNLSNPFNPNNKKNSSNIKGNNQNICKNEDLKGEKNTTPNKSNQDKINDLKNIFDKGGNNATQTKPNNITFSSNISPVQTNTAKETPKIRTNTFNNDQKNHQINAPIRNSTNTQVNNNLKPKETLSDEIFKDLFHN